MLVGGQCVFSAGEGEAGPVDVVMQAWDQMAAPVPVVPRVRRHGRVLMAGSFWSISKVHRAGREGPSACGAICRLHVDGPCERPGGCKKTLTLSEGMTEQMAQCNLKRWLLHGALMTLADTSTKRSAHRDIDARSDPRCREGLEGDALDARLLQVEEELRELNLI